MIIDCISDLHGFYPELQGGDLLIIGGDLTARDSENEVALFDYWLNEQLYKKKVVVGGNHDNVLAEGRLKLRFGEYLCDSVTEFEGLKIWGSPWTKSFEGMNPRCKAFTCDTEEELAEKWALIPEDVDILITHGPLVGFGDTVKDYSTGKMACVGSVSLKNRIWQMENPPRLIVTGHIHEGYGDYKEKWYEGSAHEFDQIIVNASHVDERYRPVNKPVRIEI